MIEHRQLTGDHVRADHVDALTEMTEGDRLAMAREVLAAMLIAEAGKHGETLTRRAALDAIFAAEADATNKGLVASTNFFLPIEADLPLSVAKPREVPADDAA